MKRLQKFVNQKILPEIRKRRINSYQVFCQFKRVLNPKRSISNQYFLLNNSLDFDNQDVLKFITLLLKKRSQQRTQLQKQSILKCFIKLKYFQQLQKQSQLQIVKLLIKNSRIIKVNKKSVIFDQQDQIQYYYIILKGKIGILENSYKSHITEKIQANLLNALIKNLLLSQPKPNNSKIKRKQSKRFNQLSNFQIQEPIFQTHDLQIQQLRIAKVVLPGQSFGDQNENLSDGRKLSAVAMEDTYLLQISLNAFLRAIKMHSDKKIKKQVQFFRKFKCFDLLQQHQLKNLIQTIKIEQKPKNEFVFRQGDQSNYFYLLLQGEIALNKMAKLFKENPNKLYANRLSWQKEKRNIKMLPFANFQNLYNYRPKQQLIQIGIIGQTNVFGQQQVFLMQPRQTNAKIISTIAKYYIIDPKQLEIILREKKYELEDFKDFMFGTTTKKKILYRQDKFSEVLTLKNKKNLDYFYLQDGEKEDKSSPRKFQLQKINNKFSQKLIVNSSAQKQIEKAFYTTFNFNKFLNPVENIEQQNQFFQSPQQKQVIELTHTTKFIQRQINSHNILYRVKKLYKKQININNPLYDVRYFTSLNKQNKKLEKQVRQKRFSVKPISNSLKKRQISNRYQVLQQ